MATNNVSVSVLISKVSKTSKGKPYAVVAASKGGNFCIFPKVGDDGAAGIVSALKAGKYTTLDGVAIYDGGVIVYSDTTVS
jgi:hypothetical protein